jgi:hypothetical protein
VLSDGKQPSDHSPLVFGITASEEEARAVPWHLHDEKFMQDEDMRNDRPAFPNFFKTNQKDKTAWQLRYEVECRK